jgi:pyridoxamine 5'-phosphate oxidase
MLTQDFPKDFGGLTDPAAIFQMWWQDAHRTQLPNPNAFALSTVDGQGRPHSRIVLAKEIRENLGVVFYTNYQSDKGLEMAANANVAALFFWDPLHRQVRINGQVKRLTRQESEAYWNSRPRSRQLSQTTSLQSKAVPNREAMEHALREVEMKFENKPVPCPSHWGGYAIEVASVEFWSGHTDRFHDRYRFTKVEKTWTAQRLYP